MSLSVRSSYSCLALFVMLLPCSSRSQQQERNEHLKPLAFFSGDWNCKGKFSSGAPIAAKLHYEPILGGAFMLFRHDDHPPHAYHAWAQWGWDLERNQFIGVYEDSTGGVRIFRSNGWRDGLLQWFGGVLPDSADQRFEFERMGEKQFRVSYSYKKNSSWIAVDSSVCSAAGR